MRHVIIDKDRDPGPGLAITSFAHEYPADSRVEEHRHNSHQLMYAIRGVMEVSATRRYWLIPPQFAVWIPARTAHRIRMASAVSMRTVYLRSAVVRGLPTTCAVLNVSPLLRELILEAVNLGSLTMRAPLHAALRMLMVAQLQTARPVPAVVTLPHDSRALRVAEAFIKNPASDVVVTELCRRLGATPRTVQRIFLRETGVSFEVWRRQVRLIKGVQLLLDGHSVTSAALALGYQQANPFIKLFRDTLGVTPRTWITTLDGRERRTERDSRPARPI